MIVSQLNPRIGQIIAINYYQTHPSNYIIHCGGEIDEDINHRTKTGLLKVIDIKSFV